MTGSTKNLGQVSGIFVGTTPPENVKLVWWDSTPSQQCHKIYDYNLKQWVILNQGILSTITYTELRNVALNVGLSVGKFYVITDKGSVLALSITRTKIQYVSVSGNLLVDDLGSNIQYYVSSNNLTIDGEEGTFNEESTKLNFNFVEATPKFDTAYLYGKDKYASGGSTALRLIKFKLSSLISTVTGNALTWNSGLYFNFNQTLLDLGDKKGGVTLYDTYVKEQEIQDQSIENIANNYATLVEQTNKLIASTTTDTEILGKKIPALSTGGEPTDAAAGDTLLTVLSKFQRYINKFKYATGIALSKDFADATKQEYVNNNDNVQTALGKLQYLIKKITKVGTISEDWEPKDYTGSISTIAGGDTLDEAFAKAQGKFNQIGDITNGVVQSKATVENTSTKRTILSLIQGFLQFNRNSSSGHTVNLGTSNGLTIRDNNNYGITANGNGLISSSLTSNIFDIPAYEKSNLSNVYGGASMLASAKAISTAPGYASLRIIAALSAVCDWNGLTPSGGYQVFDAYFANFKAGGLSLGLIHLSDNDLYLDTNCAFVSCTNSENKNVFLPADPHDGQFIIVNQVNSANIAVHGNGRRICDNNNVDSVNVGGARSCAIFVFNPNIATDAGYKWGMWVFERWSR